MNPRLHCSYMLNCPYFVSLFLGNHSQRRYVHDLFLFCQFVQIVILFYIEKGVFAFHSIFADSFLEGVPMYPLYKRLASALQETVTSGTFYSTYYKMELIGVEESLKQKESEWQKLVSEKVSEIVNVIYNCWLCSTTSVLSLFFFSPELLFLKYIHLY